MEPQMTPNSQNNFKREEQSWRHNTAWFQTILQTYGNQNCMALQSVEQNREPPDKPMLIQSVKLQQKRQEYTMGEKTVSSINGVGKTGQLHTKEWN